MGDTKAIDSMVAVLTDPFGVGHMGITAEPGLNTASPVKSRTRSRSSLKRAAAAIAEGRFKGQIVRSPSGPARAPWCSTPTNIRA